MEPTPKDDLSDIIINLAKALNQKDCSYLIVGGVAVGFYGTPRMSEGLEPGIKYDVDIWYQALPDNFYRIQEALIVCYPRHSEALKALRFNPRKAFIQFNFDDCHFDFIPELAAFKKKDFNGCYKKRVEKNQNGVILPFISKEDLILDKQLQGRKKDIADIENIKKSKPYTRPRL